MVSLWPWRRDSSSTASFEKTLSTLYTKITDTQTRLDRVRTSSRRVKALWTLYLSFGYLVYSILLFLVVGWRRLGTYEWTGLAGGPVLIYLIRTVMAAYYNFRIDSLGSRLKDLQDERATTIQRLKDATKYNSTLELLEKYGGESRPKKGKKTAEDGESGKTPGKSPGPGGDLATGRGTPGRTNLAPPPTANIVLRNSPGSSPATPQSRPGPAMSPLASPLDASEEFAPNAFEGQRPTFAPRQLGAAAELGPPRWYDRLLDLVLGEDETAAKNRFALICQSCRLVNGLAPPGTENMAQVGKWRCMACGATNGVEDEGKEIVEQVLRAEGKEAASEADSIGEGEAAGSAEEAGDDNEEELRRSRRLASSPAKADAGGVRKRKGKGEQ